MGQEKSLPDRCNSVQTAYRTSTSPSSIISRPPSRAPSSTKSYAPSAYSTSTQVTVKTSVSNSSASSSRTTDSQQTKYLKEQLYIKSYLDIAEQDRTARSLFQPAKPGIRNYTPKILVEKPPKKEVDVWI